MTSINRALSRPAVSQTSRAADPVKPSISSQTKAYAPAGSLFEQKRPVSSPVEGDGFLEVKGGTGGSGTTRQAELDGAECPTIVTGPFRPDGEPAPIVETKGGTGGTGTTRGVANDGACVIPDGPIIREA